MNAIKRRIWTLTATVVVLAGVLAVGCSDPTPAVAKQQVRYRLSELQVKAIQDAGPGAKVTGWVDSTLWLQVNGGMPLDESHPCPPFTDC